MVSRSKSDYYQGARGDWSDVLMIATESLDSCETKKRETKT